MTDGTAALHHVTWVVRDLASTLASLAPVLSAHDVIRESLPQRGVDSARIRLGDVWLVFVQPLGAGVPAERLATVGEGPLLLSLGVRSLEDAVAALAARGIDTAGPARAGVGGWVVIDLALGLPGDVTLQLCEAPDATHEPSLHPTAAEQ